MKKEFVNEADILIKELNEETKEDIHYFKSTSCKELQDFLVENALMEQKFGLSKTYLFYHKNVLAGYMTLLTDKQQIEIKGKSDNLAAFRKKTKISGYRSIPALKIGRLCVSDEFNSQMPFNKYKGLGTIMWVSILSLSKEISSKIGCRVITTHAKKSTGAHKWYKKLGFHYSHNEKRTEEMLSSQEYEAIPMFYDLQEL